MRESKLPSCQDLSRFVKLLLYLLSFKHFEHFMIFMRAAKCMLSGCQVVAGLGKSWQQPGLFGDQQLLQFSEALRNKAKQSDTMRNAVADAGHVGNR